MTTVAIIGKPNVGKSTLFNRLVNAKKSIIDDHPGVTRDRICGTCLWLNRTFKVIDTGGYSLKKLSFQENINIQVELAIKEAQIIVFLVSNQNAIDNDDIYIAKLLKKLANHKKVILACNKGENFNYNDLNKFYALGFGKPLIISSAHGIGIGNLLDEIINKSNDISFNDDKNNSSSTTFCILGRPNVGKSSLVNAILKQDRVIVSEIAGTTIDAIDVDFTHNHKQYTLIDTAGIRRKGKIVNIEKYSLIRSELAISQSKIIILMLDGSQPLSELDETIAGMAFKANIPVVFVVNKIDLIDDFNQQKQIAFKNEIKTRFKFLVWAPIIFISAKNQKNINKLFQTFEKILNECDLKITTSLLNETILKAQMLQQPPLFKGRRIEICYATQVKSQIPTFVLFCNNVNSLHFSYARYIENKIRTSFGIDMVPIVLYWKDKNNKKGISVSKYKNT